MDQVTHVLGDAGTSLQVVHVYPGGPIKLNAKVSRTTRGYTWEVTAMGSESVEELLAAIKDAEAKLRAEFGEPEDES